MSLNPSESDMMDLALFRNDAPGQLVAISGSDPALGAWKHRAFVSSPLGSDMPTLSPATFLHVADARAALAEALLASLDSHVDNESACAAEINRRVAELDAGTVSTIPWAEVRNRLFERARHRAIGRLRNGLDLHWMPGSREELHRW